MEAHRVIFTSAGPLFQKNIHTHSLINLRGVIFHDLTRSRLNATVFITKHIYLASQVRSGVKQRKEKKS